MKLKINVNGSIKEVDKDKDLEEVVRSLVKKDQGLIVEVNKKIIPRNQWKGHSLHEGDMIELINFVGGG